MQGSFRLRKNAAMEIHAVIFNWRGHWENALCLEKQIGGLVRTSVVNSESGPALTQTGWHHVGEEAYFAAQWNKALELFKGNILFHVQADATIQNVERIIERAAILIERHNLGVYEPHIDYTDREYDRTRLQAIERDLFLVPMTDCTCWFIHGDIVRAFRPMDLALNKYGWGVDLAAAAFSHANEKRCARDYSVHVSHPRRRGYSTAEAVAGMQRYIGSLDPAIRQRAMRLHRASHSLHPNRAPALISADGMGPKPPVSPAEPQPKAERILEQNPSPAFNRTQARHHFITYATERYLFDALRLKRSALAIGGFDTAEIFKPDCLDLDFQRRNAAVLAEPRGAGLYLWKPYLIDRFLNSPQVAFGDVVCYCDSLFLFRGSCREFLGPLLNASGPIALFKNKPNERECLEQSYTKKLAFTLMGATPGMWDTSQVWAGFLAFKKTEASLKFVAEWLRNCQLPEILTDKVNDEHATFIDHRHDQSVLSLTAKKAGIPFHALGNGPLQSMRLRPNR